MEGCAVPRSFCPEILGAEIEQIKIEMHWGMGKTLFREKWVVPFLQTPCWPFPPNVYLGCMLEMMALLFDCGDTFSGVLFNQGLLANPGRRIYPVTSNRLASKPPGCLTMDMSG
jgi:hypothetical protein